jgi:predicted dehydrogenase
MKRIRCGIVGYGPTFDFGRAHGRWISGVPELELVAICDKDPARTDKAAKDFPGVRTHNSLPELLARADIDLVSVVLPHNLHKEIVVECLRAGKHTIVDKPMAITAAECDSMIDAANRAGRTLAVFHNRRHDGNYRTVQSIVKAGTIGKVFRIECWTGGFGPPGKAWRSKAAVTGGALYDWGAHATDWVLNLVDSPVASVTGFAQKLLWHDLDIEDEAQAAIRFEDGTVGTVGLSYISAVGKPLWTVLGTKGAIIDTGRDSLTGYCPDYELVAHSKGSLTLVTMEKGGRQEKAVPYEPSDWVTYYSDMAKHLLEGAAVPVSAKAGRRVIAVLEAAKRSAASGLTEQLHGL